VLGEGVRVAGQRPPGRGALGVGEGGDVVLGLPQGQRRERDPAEREVRFDRSASTAERGEDADDFPGSSSNCTSEWACHSLKNFSTTWAGQVATSVPTSGATSSM